MTVIIEGKIDATGLKAALVASRFNDFIVSRLVAGAVDALRREAGGGMVPASLDVADARSTAATLLDPAALDRAWSEGRQLSLEEAVQEGRALARAFTNG